MTKDRILHNASGDDGHLVEFIHEDVGKLQFWTGINDIEWGYRLHTAAYPTYGGEVIQILGASVEVMNIGGHLKTYEDMVQVYSYFFQYFQIATQGNNRGKRGVDRYNQKHMTFNYPERNWSFQIQPMSAPGFHIGREVAIPEWRIQTHVEHFHGSNLKEAIMNEAALNATMGYKEDKADFDFFKLKAETGYTEASPFSDPFSSADSTQTTGMADASAVIQKNAEYYKQLLPAYMAGDFQSLLHGFDSKPSAGNSSDAESTKKTTRGVNKLDQAANGN